MSNRGWRRAIYSGFFNRIQTSLLVFVVQKWRSVMDIARLAKDIGNLRYEAEYRFESGAPYYQTLREGDVRGILIALRDRGYTISRENEAHVESPPTSITDEIHEAHRQRSMGE